MDILYAIFENDEHEVRVGGHFPKDKPNKTWWLAYVQREPLTKHLDDKIGGDNWSFITGDPHVIGKTVTYNGTLTINGVARMNNGTGSINDEKGIKGAVTDTFKRCCSSWGMGLYLQRTPSLITAYAGDTPASQRKLEPAAMKELAPFLNAERNANQTVPPPPRQNAPQASADPLPEALSGFLDREAELIETKLGISRAEARAFVRAAVGGDDRGLLIANWESEDGQAIVADMVTDALADRDNV